MYAKFILYNHLLISYSGRIQVGFLVDFKMKQEVSGEVIMNAEYMFQAQFKNFIEKHYLQYFNPFFLKQINIYQIYIIQIFVNIAFRLVSSRVSD